MSDSLGDRMKRNYEDRFRFKLVRRMPVIIRLDGNCFSTLTKYAPKPFDSLFRIAMVEAAKVVMDKAQGSKCCYVQSDEISILLTDYDSLTTESWFDSNIQKICSVSSGITSVEFSKRYLAGWFDCRVFNIPESEVVNYFVWRQKDWIRNSVSMLARSHFSHKQLQNKNTSDMHDMLHEKGVNWTDLESHWKNGTFITKEVGEWKPTPVFTENRSCIEDCFSSGGSVS